MKKIVAKLVAFLYPLIRLYWFLLRPRGRGVKVAITHKNEILLVRHSYGKKYWTLPGGGMRKNETSEESAKREVKEEVGIELKNVSPLGRFLKTDEYKQVGIWIFKAEVPNKKLGPKSFEIEEAQWFDLDDLPSNIGSTAKKFLEFKPPSPHR